MTLKYQNSIKKEYFKVVTAALAVVLIMSIIFLNNRIPHFEIDLNEVATPETNRFEIDTHNPYSLKSFFLPYDLSISSYTYILNDKADEKQMYAFQNPYEYCDFYTEYNVDDDLTDPRALVIFPEEKVTSISFFAKFLTSEDLQSFRTFFYSEVFAMLLAVLGIRIYKLQNLRYRQKLGKSISFGNKVRKRIIASYCILSILTFIIIILISRIQTIEIHENTFKQDNNWFTFFKPYDISRSYYQFHVKLSDSSNTIRWESADIVEFRDFSRKPEVKTSKLIEFHPLYSSSGFHVSFNTKNLVLHNLQEIRLFILSTFLLLFIVRLSVHVKNYVFDINIRLLRKRRKR